MFRPVPAALAATFVLLAALAAKAAPPEATQGSLLARGEEGKLLEAVRKLVGESRVFPLGVGFSVNRYLLEEMALAGRGAARTIRQDAGKERIEKDVRAFYERIAKPVLTDLEVDWHGLPVADLYPPRVPDLFAGQPVEITGRYTAPGSAEIVLRGRLGGKVFQRTVSVVLVTIWMVAALKSAREAGLRVEPEALAGARLWLDRVTDPDSGRVGYRRRGEVPPAVGKDRPPLIPCTERSLTAAGILGRLFLGEDPGKSEAIGRAVELCRKEIPSWSEKDPARIDMGYWYFGTLALFQVGGPAWKTWDQGIRDAILRHQRKDGAAKGSWDPVGPGGRELGRVGATALMKMCLMVHYRYSRVFGLR